MGSEGGRYGGMIGWLRLMAIYDGTEMVVRAGNGLTDWFEVLVDLHWGSLHSPLLGIHYTVMEVSRREIHGSL